VTSHISQFAFPLILSVAFAYFFLAGSRTFIVRMGDDFGTVVAHVSFLLTGAIPIGVLGGRNPIPPLNESASVVVLCCSLGLYEWARHVIRGRNFSIAWSDRVPEAICRAGPYHYIRHPIYGSYILAFLASAIAVPSALFLACLILNSAIFVHAAISDEGSIEGSILAEEYSRYRYTTGMFFPKLIG
jgi:protein-S-isoprenylcysteine O-methyltransferase Ste14